MSAALGDKINTFVCFTPAIFTMIFASISSKEVVSWVRFKIWLTVPAWGFQNTGVRFAMPPSIFGAICKPALTNAGDYMFCWTSYRFGQLQATGLRREIWLNVTQMHNLQHSPAERRLPWDFGMRLWFRNFPSSALGNIENAVLFVVQGRKHVRRLTMSYPLSPIVPAQSIIVWLAEEMARRGYNVSPDWLTRNHRGKTRPPYQDLAEGKAKVLSIVSMTMHTMRSVWQISVTRINL